MSLLFISSFSFNISPSIEYSGFISFRIDWFDLLAIQGTLKSLSSQHHSSKVSILWLSAFFMVYPSHPYMITGKTIILTTQTFVRQVMLLLCNMLSRFVIAFPPKSKHLLISWLQSPPSAVMLEPKKIKSATTPTFSLSIFSEVMELDAMILVFWMLCALFEKKYIRSKSTKLRAVFLFVCFLFYFFLVKLLRWKK